VHRQFLVLKPISARLVAPAVLWLSLLNATLCTFAPVLMVMMAIERVGAPVAAQTGMVGPISTILMSVAILGEPFTAWVAAGPCACWPASGCSRTRTRRSRNRGSPERGHPGAVRGAGLRSAC
jgi:hypothetical protein